MGWRLGLAAASILMLGAGAAWGEEFTEANGAVDFDLPSMNICCSHKPGTADLYCTRVKPKYWIVTLSQSGAMSVNKDPGEVPGCGYGAPLGNVLDYGESWSMDGFTCSAATDGLTCKASGKGFKLAKKGLKKLN